MDALAGVDLRLAIERQMVGIFGNEDVGDGRLGGHAALDQPCRRRRLDDDALAGRAAIAGTAGDEHPELRRHDVETLGEVLADDMQGMAAARTGLVLDVDDHLDPRQVGRQRASICPALGGALCPHCRGRGLVGRLVIGRGLLDFLKAEQKLIFRQRLGPAAKAVALQFLDDLLETFGPQTLGDQHRLERAGIVGKRVGRGCHTRSESSRHTGGNSFCVARGQPDDDGTRLVWTSWTRRQSRPSSSADSCAAVRCRTLSSAFGQRN